MKGRHKVFDIEIYNKQLVVVDTTEAKYVNKLIDDENPLDNSEELYGMALAGSHKKASSVLLVVNTKHKEFGPHVVVHEAVHCANMIFHIIGHKLSTNDDEPQAYLTAWMFKKAMGFIYESDK